MSQTTESNNSSAKRGAHSHKSDSEDPNQTPDNFSKPGTEAAAACKYCLELRITETGPDGLPQVPTHSYQNCPNKGRYNDRYTRKHRRSSSGEERKRKHK